MQIVMGILAIVVVILGLFAMTKDKALGGFYKSIKVCGRWYAFITMDLLCGGVVGIVATIVMFIKSIASGSWDGYSMMIMLICAAICLVLGVPLYLHALKKCPEELKKRLFWDMLVMMFGATFRVSLFFMMFLIKTWWEMHKPVAYTVDGKTVYAYPGENDLYDDHGNRVGVTDADRSKAIMY